MAGYTLQANNGLMAISCTPLLPAIWGTNRHVHRMALIYWGVAYYGRGMELKKLASLNWNFAHYKDLALYMPEVSGLPEANCLLCEMHKVPLLGKFCCFAVRNGHKPAECWNQVPPLWGQAEFLEHRMGLSSQGTHVRSDRPWICW